MPRPCAVESHARRYKKAHSVSPRCHGLAPWSLTLAATRKRTLSPLDATALRRGVSRSPLQKKPPNLTLFVAASVNLHGTRPSHPQTPASVSCSCERETSTAQGRGILNPW